MSPYTRRDVLWTRVTPSAAATPGSGVGPDVTVTWQVTTSPTFRRPVAQGTTTATAARDHTVEVDVTGLSPSTTYWYRLLLGTMRDNAITDSVDDILNVPPRTASVAVETAFRGANPHIKYLDFDSHGYSVLEVRPDGVRVDWYVLSERTDPDAASALSTSWRVAAGTQKVVHATGGLL